MENAIFNTLMSKNRAPKITDKNSPGAHFSQSSGSCSRKGYTPPSTHLCTQSLNHGDNPDHPNQDIVFQTKPHGAMQMQRAPFCCPNFHSPTLLSLWPVTKVKWGSFRRRPQIRTCMELRSRTQMANGMLCALQGINMDPRASNTF